MELARKEAEQPHRDTACHTAEAWSQFCEVLRVEAGVLDQFEALQVLLKDLSSLLRRTRSTHTTANTRAQQTFATWQLACSPSQGAEEEPDLWQRGQEHCHQRAGLSLQHFGSTGAPINTQLSNSEQMYEGLP